MNLQTCYKLNAINLMKETPMLRYFNILDNRFYHSPDGNKLIYTNNANQKSDFFEASSMPIKGYIQLGMIND